MPIPFIKMHGLGNDYVYVDGFTHTVTDPGELSIRIADRHFGIGSDGLILVLPPESGVDAHCRMRMFNADGSEGQMCGNGIRCVCKFAHDHRLFPGARKARPMRVQTDNGVLTLAYTLDPTNRIEAVTVDMGEPRIDAANIPIDVVHMKPTAQPQTYELDAGDLGKFTVTCVSTGNPHGVIFLDSPAWINLGTRNSGAWLQELGPVLERHPAFPRRANIHFVSVNTRSSALVVHWERGSGPTLACGTGASAVCVAGVLTGQTNRELTTELPGGELQIEWRESDNHVYMTGPATEVYAGVWPE